MRFSGKVREVSLLCTYYLCLMGGVLLFWEVFFSFKLFLVTRSSRSKNKKEPKLIFWQLCCFLFLKIMNNFVQLDFMDMYLPAFWSSVSATVKFCTYLTFPIWNERICHESLITRCCWWWYFVLWTLRKSVSYTVLATKSCYQTPFLQQLSKAIENGASRIWNTVIQVYQGKKKRSCGIFIVMLLSLTHHFLSNSL